MIANLLAGKDIDNFDELEIIQYLIYSKLILKMINNLIYKI